MAPNWINRINRSKPQAPRAKINKSHLKPLAKSKELQESNPGIISIKPLGKRMLMMEKSMMIVHCQSVTQRMKLKIKMWLVGSNTAKTNPRRPKRMKSPKMMNCWTQFKSTISNFSTPSTLGILSINNIFMINLLEIPNKMVTPIPSITLQKGFLCVTKMSSWPSS